MPDVVDSLILDLLEWIGPATRPYDEVMEAWRTSCPRLPVWEEANRRGLVRRSRDRQNRTVVARSSAGTSLLEGSRTRHPEQSRIAPVR
jgi:D-3-phosphoglycerate dehydrogenase / 2-oxoglutarate reductase